MTMSIFIVNDGVRSTAPSLTPYLTNSLKTDATMDATRMSPTDVARCRWIGFGIGKGVTHPHRDISIFAIPTELTRGLHGELIQGFPDVDPVPLCYDGLNHVHGFGGFIRWVHFANPKGGPGIFGIDWSIVERPTAGIATSWRSVAQLVVIVTRHGIPRDTEVVLLNWRMCEEPEIEHLRQSLGLGTIDDWMSRGHGLFGPASDHCPRCGIRTLQNFPRYCFRCGCEPRRFWEVRSLSDR